MRMDKQVKKKKLNNKGMTMVEIMVGFALLAIFLAGLTKLIMFSSEMIQQSVDLRHAQNRVWAEAYKNTPGEVIAGTVSLKEEGEGTENIVLDNVELRCVEQEGDINGIKLKVYVYAAKK